jgi:hypothetical protein
MSHKNIFKIITLCTLTLGIWCGVFALSGRQGCFIVTHSMGLFTADTISSNPDQFVWLGPIFLVFPGLIWGMIGGVFFVFFLNYVLKSGKKEHPLISSLKYRTRSFLSYCIFLGESSLAVFTIGGVFLPIISLVFSSEKVMAGNTELTVLDYLIRFAIVILVTILSVLIIWKCEVYIAKDKQSAAPSGPAGQQQYPASVLLAMLLGGILLTVLTLCLLNAIFWSVVMTISF